MIKEFALDPAAVSDWGNFRWLTSQFGCEYGRLISRFPSGWKKIVYELCSQSDHISQLQLSRIEIILFNLEYEFDKKLIKNNRSFDFGISWLENALESNISNPFSAIISLTETDNVLTPESIDEYTELWKTSTGTTVKRSPNDLVNYFRPFFKFGKEILFVDSHFDPGVPRYYRAFICYFNNLFSIGKVYKNIAIHTSDTISIDHFVGQFIKRFSNSIPGEANIYVFRWKQLEDNENFHARYLLTDFGGLSIDYGFDEGSENETTDIKLLSKEIYNKRILNINKDSDIFQLNSLLRFSKKSRELIVEYL